jgi:hypothetical protein
MRSLATPERLVARFCMLPKRSVPKLPQQDRSSRRRESLRHRRWLDSHESGVAPALGVSDLYSTKVGAVSTCSDRCFVPTPRRVRIGGQPAILNLLRTTNAARSKHPQLSGGTSNMVRVARNHGPTNYLEAQNSLADQPASAFRILSRFLHAPANPSCSEDEYKALVDAALTLVRAATWTYRRILLELTDLTTSIPDPAGSIWRHFKFQIDGIGVLPSI